MYKLKLAKNKGTPRDTVYVYSNNGTLIAPCGSTDAQANTSTQYVGTLDITTCTVTHELGHVLVARSVMNMPANLARVYAAIYDPTNHSQIFGVPNPQCPSGGNQFDPGINVSDQNVISSWPWRDHPIIPYSKLPKDYPTYLCNSTLNNPFNVLREFEADMIMNFVQNFFNLGNSAQKQRFLWLYDASNLQNSQFYSWVISAQQWTITP